MTGLALVTGGTGFVGAHVVRELLRRGLSVRCLVRPGSDRRNIKGLAVETAEGDLLRPETWDPALSGVRWLFHVAADYRLWVRDAAHMRRVNVEGTVRFLQAAWKAGVEKMVYTSSVAALGCPAGNGEVMDESNPADPGEIHGAYKFSKYLAEREVLDLARQGCPVVIVNPSAPIGPLDVKPTPTGKIIVDFLNRRMPAYLDTGLNFAAVEDVAAGHGLALERGRAGERYILGGTNLTLQEAFGILSRFSGIASPRVRIPYFVAWAAGAASIAWASLTGGTPRVPLDGVRVAKYKMFFSSAKAERELGYRPGDTRQAFLRAVRWFVENGYVRKPLPLPVAMEPVAS
ncbi:MAG: NAD-dependent epimerase/dehydratase family protein [Elusimicrobia bacterium]|nr:NAD-dependent epimerase/dehydratase family protein [Elusimicrobiota bacterium]